MLKKIDSVVKARAVRLVAEHASEYPNRFSAITAVAKQVGVSQESAQVGGACQGRSKSRPALPIEISAACRVVERLAFAE